jgi:hypothetical protein
VTVAIKSQKRNRNWEQNDFGQLSCKFHYRRKTRCRVACALFGTVSDRDISPATTHTLGRAWPGRLVRLKQWAGCSEEPLTLLCTLGGTSRPRYTSQTNTPPPPRKDRQRPQRAFTPSSLAWYSYDEFNLVSSKLLQFLSNLNQTDTKLLEDRENCIHFFG